MSFSAVVRAADGRVQYPEIHADSEALALLGLMQMGYVELLGIRSLGVR